MWGLYASATASQSDTMLPSNFQAARRRSFWGGGEATLVRVPGAHGVTAPLRVQPQSNIQVHLYCSRQARGNAVDGVVGAHDLLDICLLYAGPKRGQVCVVQIKLWKKGASMSNRCCFPAPDGGCRETLSHFDTCESLASKLCLVKPSDPSRLYASRCLHVAAT